IRTLDKNIAQRLHTGQVIVDVESIVKELIENSLDAHASNVDILLVDNGLTEIQVKDDGCGIPEKDRTTMAKLYTTSKIAHYNDLKYLKTFGFRG
ncbi:histidine kinase-like ATPase, partial [Dichotomocladium elegans]